MNDKILQVKFERAAKEATKLPKRPDDETLLELYGLYKQATKGDVSGKRPGMLDFVGKAKFGAWTQQKGKSKAKAMKDYIALVESLKH